MDLPGSRDLIGKAVQGGEPKGKNSCAKPVAFWLKKIYRSIYNLSCSTKDLRHCLLVGKPLMPILGVWYHGLPELKQGAKSCSHSLCWGYNGYSRHFVLEYPFPAHPRPSTGLHRENGFTIIQFLFVFKLQKLTPGFAFPLGGPINKIHQEMFKNQFEDWFSKVCTQRELFTFPQCSVPCGNVPTDQLSVGYLLWVGLGHGGGGRHLNQLIPGKCLEESQPHSKYSISVT